MQLVVEELALRIRARLSGELSAAGCVSDRHTGDLVIVQGRTVHDSNSGLYHDLVNDLGVTLHLEVTRLCDVHKAREKSFPGDAHLVEFQVAIVDCVVTKLGADISNLDTW